MGNLSLLPLELLLEDEELLDDKPLELLIEPVLLLELLEPPLDEPDEELLLLELLELESSLASAKPGFPGLPLPPPPSPQASNKPLTRNPVNNNRRLLLPCITSIQ
jgi:hypothetical protein